MKNKWRRGDEAIRDVTVDASWKNEKEGGGIGWSLHSKEGIQKLQGSSSIIPTNSPIEAEAVALLMATQQMRRLQYRNVAFISDCKKLIDELHQCLAGKTITKARHTEILERES
ncbi:PREDICTED: uncharacterized protein LOC106324102 [Brassica oleracea var. oleracea]|uniref:uncharacterized protein LOC106324102 n=1 Tax=Brassica oleracea var. oleracea TaxID=109376 RepID=UPI0006A70070|nr:PREDICTED: uncharacterized protein LOC106324102 [Brassica oleracea var. oleracea]